VALRRGSLDIVAIAVVAAAYIAAAKLGLTLAFVNASATAVWPPAGIALAALLLRGPRLWPAVFIGAFVANITTAGSAATSLGIAAGNTLEALAGMYLVTRFASGRDAFSRGQDVIKFFFLAALVSTTVSATIGVAILTLGGFARWSDAGSIWLTWWLGDAAGDLLVAPLLILWSKKSRVRWSSAKLLEAGLLLLSLMVIGLVVFGGLFLGGRRGYPIAFIALPTLVWAAFRFAQRETATTSLLLATMALWGTLHGLGPFAREDPNESLVLVQAFTGLSAVLALAFAALVAEKERVDEERIALIPKADAARRLAESSEQRARFLAEMSAILGSSLDYDTTLSRVARLSVPILADLCAVDLLQDNGTTRRVAQTHVNPAKESCRRVFVFRDQAAARASDVDRTRGPIFFSAQAPSPEIG
jgi:integral membrane sensor domain MASE1